MLDNPKWISSIECIREAKENNQLVVFVGAGVSKNSNVPTWWHLIKRFAEELNYDRCDECTCKKKDEPCTRDKDECRNRYAFSQEEFLRIPQYYYQNNTENDHESYFNLIRTTLSGGDGPNPIDDEIFALLPRHIITTNYDSLLEDSKAANAQFYATVSKDSELLSVSSERYIIKMHGDLNDKDTLVLKENDYIDYENNHPLISTFIRSLLINHTFIFLGYSLNDYNLNLIIGWINYFRKLHGVESGLSNFLISAHPATDLERDRLVEKSIQVIDLNSLPDDLAKKISIPEALTDVVGQKLYLYLKCISNPNLLKEYIPLKKQLEEKYKELLVYDKISYQDLISVYPLGRTTFMDTQLVFYQKEWFDRIKDLMNEQDSIVAKTFKRAGISTIHNYDDNASAPVPNAYEPIEEEFQLYFDNRYADLDELIKSSSKLTTKMFYSHFLGKDKQEVDELLNVISSKIGTNYIEILLQKMRKTIADLHPLSVNDIGRQEVQQVFDTMPEKRRNSTSFLRMLFTSSAVKIYEMEKLLEKHEKRYERQSNTMFFGAHSHISLWELKALAYDYFFFFIENGLPLHYFSDPKKYLSCYLRAILCTYTPRSNSDESGFVGIKQEYPHYSIGEVDLDMLTKYTSSKDLKAWIKKYNVHWLELEKDIDVVRKFTNLCKSFQQYRIKYWGDQINCYAIILCLLKLTDEEKANILNCLSDFILDASEETPLLVEEVFDAIDYIITHMSLNNGHDAYKQLISGILKEDVWPLLTKYKYNQLVKVTRKLQCYVDDETRSRLVKKLESEESLKTKCKQMYLLRFALSKSNCSEFLHQNIKELNVEEIFNLVIDDFIPFDKNCWQRFLETLKREDDKRKSTPGMRTVPDWLTGTIDECLILKLLDFDVDLQELQPFVEYSNHLKFMLEPSAFDYSLVDTGDYMWQNLIYSNKYQAYFVENRSKILSVELNEIFKKKLETVDQQKIVYGILLSNDEVQRFGKQ